MRALLLVPPVIAALASPAAARQTDLHGTLEAVREKFHAPAITGAVIRDGKILGSGVCGVRALDGDQQQPATASDRWPIGSCTKPMTRFMIGRLIERGDLALDMTLATLLPDVPMRPEYRSEPLIDLLAHRAGIQPYTQIGPRITPFIFQLHGSPQEQQAAFAAHVLDEAPAAPPGTAFVYSNAGYCLAAVIAERKTGKTWETLVAEEVFKPLGMTASVAGFETAPDQQPRGHDHEGGAYRTVARDRPGLPVMFPAGGVKATAEDFARFAGAYADLAAGRAVGGLSEQTAAKIREARPGDQPASTRPDAFFGGDGEFTAAFAVWPAEHLAIAVASNAGDSDDLCAAAIEAIRAAQAPDAAPQAAGGPKSGPGPRYGFQLRVENESWVVAAVEPDSIADKAGLKPGDTITAINGRSHADIAPDDLSSLLHASKVKLTVTRDDKSLEIELTR